MTPYSERTPDSIKTSVDSITPDALAELRDALQTWFDKHQPEAFRDFASDPDAKSVFGHAYDWFAYGN